MSENSVPRFGRARLEDIQEAIGIVRFNGEKEWNLTISGLIIQGGYTETAGAVAFDPALPKQILFLNHSAGAGTIISITGFTAPGAGYWLAIGV
jgi:hypothetical protein